MALYTERGSNIYVGNTLDVKRYTSLPTRTYLVSFSQQEGFYLTIAPEFELPSKIYGDATRNAERFLNTFESRKGTTGILLSGTKGSGKSLVMKMTSVYGLKRDIPTLIVASAYCGEAFNEFIQNIDQPCIVIFDEFEKVYDADRQQSLLTLFDGTFTTKKLMIVTCNEAHKVDSHMINRPGRMFYYLKYKGITEAFIREYCEDRLNDKIKTNTIVTLASMFSEFNFDMLQALVEELNRYPEESVKQAIDILNINYDNYIFSYYNVSIVRKDDPDIVLNYTPTEVRNPLQEDYLHVRIVTNSANNYEPSKADIGHKIDDGEIVMFPMQTGKVFVGHSLSLIRSETNQYVMTLTKREPKIGFDYSSLL